MDLKFERAGESGEVLKVLAVCPAHFRGERFEVDAASPSSSSILGIKVYTFPPGRTRDVLAPPQPTRWRRVLAWLTRRSIVWEGVSANAFAPDVLGNTLAFPTCASGDLVEVEVRLHAPCIWRAVLRGRALAPQLQVLT